MSSTPIRRFAATDGRDVSYQSPSYKLRQFRQAACTYVCFSSSRNASLAWRSPMLLIYWISPFWKFIAREYFSAKKCTASRASACASVMGGMFGERFCSPKPVKLRREYWMIAWPSSTYNTGLIVKAGSPPNLFCSPVSDARGVGSVWQTYRGAKVPSGFLLDQVVSLLVRCKCAHCCLTWMSLLPQRIVGPSRQ